MFQRRLHRAVLHGFIEEPLKSRSKHGRFHSGLEKPTIYLAERWETAWHEVLHRWSADPAKYKHVCVSLQLQTNNVIDLTDESVRSSYHITEAELLSDDYTACQGLATRLRGQGVEAIRTFSRADRDGRVLVVFLECLNLKSYIHVESVEALNMA